MTLERTQSWLKCLVVLLATAGCAPAVFGDGTVVTQTKDLPPFTGVELAGALDATASVGAQTLTLIGEGNILAQYDVAVVGQTLVIAPKQYLLLQPTQPVQLRFSVPRLEAVSVSGATKMATEALVSATEVDLEANGSSTLVTGAISAPKVNLAANGSSALTLFGTTDTGRFDVGGASKVVAAGLASDRLEMSVNGSSRLEARASKEVRGTVNGASEVTIEGSPPERDLVVGGASVVTFK